MRRDAFSLLELVIGVTIFALAFIPIVELLSTSRRTAASSLRFLEASSYAQTLLEAIEPLDASELPAGDGEWTLLSSQGAAAAGTGTRWPEVQRFFDAPPPFPMTARVVTATRVPNAADPTRPDRVLLRVRVEFLRVVTIEDSEQDVSLEGMLDPR